MRCECELRCTGYRIGTSSLPTFLITGACSALEINQAYIALITLVKIKKKKRQRPREQRKFLGGSIDIETRPLHTRCLDYLQISREIYTAIQPSLPLPASSLLPRLKIILRLALIPPPKSWTFFSRPVVQPLFAAVELIGKITRPGEEAKLTPDAMPETRMQPGREEARARQNREARGEGGGEDRRVRLLRGAAPLSFAVAKSSGSRNECCVGTRNRVLEYVPRSSMSRTESNEVRATKYFAEWNSEKLKLKCYPNREKRVTNARL